MNLSKLTGSVLLAATLLSFTACDKSGGIEFDNFDLIPVKTTKDGKWSMINDKGEIVYDNEFKNRPTAAYNGLFTVKENDGYTVYSVGDKSPKAVTGLENLKSVGILSEGLLPVTLNHSRITMVDKSGKTKFELQPVKGKEIVWCASYFEEGLLLFKTEDDKFGYLSTDGKVAIEPKFDSANGFSDGLAVIGHIKDEDHPYDLNYSVIDKSGKTIFKIKEEHSLVTSQFNHGYIVTKKDDRLFFVNKKGEETKLPSKISSIQGYNNKYIVFENDGNYGVADLKGEIIIRAKYDFLMFDTSDTFFAKKDSDDNEIIRLNSKGEEERKIDYDYILNLGKFGYIVAEGKTSLLLDDKFNKKGNEEFFDFNLDPEIEYGVNSDYFNPDGVAGVIVGMINGKKVCGLTLGENVKSVMSGRSPSDYSYRSEFEIDDEKKEGFRYTITPTALFTNRMASYDYNYNTYSGDYSWNPNAILGGVKFDLSTQSEWGKDGMKALKNAFEKAGFKLVKEGGNKSLFKKGTILAAAESADTSCGIFVVDSAIPALGDMESILKSQISGSGDNEETVAAIPEEVVEADTAVAAQYDVD